MQKYRNWIYITIGIAFILSVYYFIHLKKSRMNDINLSIKLALTKYPREIVENAERLFRLETAHFSSNQFKSTFSAGMEKFSKNYPFGWNSLDREIWSKKPEYKPVSSEGHVENGTGITKYFLKFHTFEASFMTVCAFLFLHKNNAGRWFSLKLSNQLAYNEKIKNIKSTFTNEIA